MKIKEAPAPVITVTPEEGKTAEMVVGDTQILTAAIYPPVSGATVIWSSNNEAVVTIDQTGKVTAIATGNATITAAAEGVTSGTLEINVAAAVVPPAGIVLKRAKETTFVGETIQLLPTAENDDATAGGWKFTSSDTNVATVDASTGVVTGVADGTCIITITNDYAPGLSKECNVTVWTNLLVNGGFEASEMTPWGMNGAGNTAINNGLLTVGLDTTHSYSGNQSAKLSATGNSDVEVRLNQNKIAVTEGTTYKFLAKMKAEDFTASSSIAYKIQCWKGDGKNGDPNTTLMSGKVIEREVKVSDSDWVQIEGIYTIPAEGAWIAAQMWFNGTGTAWIDEVAVIEWQPITEITLDTKSKYIELDEEYTLIVTTLPVESLDHTVIFESSNSEIASVDENGKITAKSIGEAVITATATNGGVSAQCKITVIEEYIALENIELISKLELCVGSQETLGVTYTPATATNKEILWSISDEAIATVDENGLITALSEGTATITASADNNVAKACEVTVRKSTALLTEKAEITTDYGKSIQGDLKNYITNNTGSADIIFDILMAPANGTMELTADGTFSYLPKGNFDTTEKDSFITIVAAGTETALLEGEITVNAVEDSLSKLMTGGTTLLITRAELEEIKADIKDETSVRYKIWNNYKLHLETLLNSTPPAYEEQSDEDNEYALWMREVGNTTAHLLWAYLFTGEEAYKAKCLEWAEASVSYPKWSTYDWYQEADLAAGHQAYALGLVYNWLHDEMSDNQRSAIEKKLYYIGGQFVKKWGESNQYLQNHLWIASAGLCSIAMSFYIHAADVAETVGVDEATVKSNCASWIELVCNKVGFTFQVMPHDGANHEGAAYHLYGLEYLLKSALLLNSNLDIDMFTGSAWLENSSDYFSNVIMPKNSLKSGTGLIDYADGNRSSWHGPSHLYRVLAGIYQDGKAQWIAEVFEDSKADLANSSYWMGILFADSDVEAVSPADTEESTLYFADDLGIAVSRSDWSGDESMLFIRNGLPLGKTAKALINHDILKAGTNESHADPDNNAVILYSNGEYLLKSDGYAFKKTSNHSTLIIGDTGASASEDFTGQLGEGKQGMDTDDYLDLDYEPEFTVLQENDTYNYLVGNATEAYAPSLGLKKFERNIVFLKEENVMLIVDDIKTINDKILQLRWFPEFKNVTEAYGIYSVYGNKNILKFYPFTTENTTTAFVEVDVYKRGGGTQKEKAFTQTLNGTSWQNAVAFTWGEDGTAQTGVKYLTGQANEHKFEVNGKIYTINVADNTVMVETGKLPLEENEWVSDSSLSQILFNTITLDAFKSDTYEYTVEKFWKVKELTILPVPTAPNATAKLEWDGKCPGVVKITCTSEDGKNTSYYTINLTDNDGLLDIVGTSSTVIASKSETFMYDSIIQLAGNDKTWSCLNLPKVTFDLGTLADISKIDVAFNNSSKRSTYYNLWISEDGNEWTALVEDGESPMTTTGLLTDYQTLYKGDAVRARYVRVDLRSQSEGGKDNVKAVNSIQEISVYGQMIVEDDENTGIKGKSGEGAGIGSESTGGEDKETDNGNDVADDEGDNDDAKEIKEEHSEVAAAAPTGDESFFATYCMLFLMTFGIFVIAFVVKNKQEE